MRNNNFGVYIVVFGFFVMVGFVWFMVAARNDAVVEVEEESVVLEEDVLDEVVLEGEKGGEVLQEKEKLVLDVKMKQEVVQTKSEDERYLERLAGNFIERYETYSNQSNYANLIDSSMLMTVTMKNRVLDNIEERKMSQGDVEGYFGVTTRAVTKELLGYEKGDLRTRVRVKAIRTEYLDGGEGGDLIQKEYEVVLAKISGDWGVDSVLEIE